MNCTEIGKIAFNSVATLCIGAGMGAFVLGIMTIMKCSTPSQTNNDQPYANTTVNYSQLPRFAVVVPVAEGLEKLSLVDQPKSLMQCQALAQVAKGECVIIVEEVYPDGVRIAPANDQTSTRWIGNSPSSTKP